MNPSMVDDIHAIQSISAVPTIMNVIAETTGLRFVCVTRVTPQSWTACAVLDKIDFGLKPGDELDVATTICDEVRAGNTAVIIDQVSADPTFCRHHTPAMYGFESYFSIPVYRPGGEFFGTLCGLDPLPAELKTPKIRDMLMLFADLISRQLESAKRLTESEAALRNERETAELREQFVAVLGHDLRTPLSSITAGAELLKRLPHDASAESIVQRMERSAQRIANLVDDLMDFTRGRMGGGIQLKLEKTDSLAGQLQQVVAELESAYPHRTLHSDIRFDQPVWCDPRRIAQLLSNLLKNALVHGDRQQPVRVFGRCEGDVFRLAVSNGGTPIPEETKSRLFQPFWRGTGKGNADGLGLGLYIAAEIARAHKGSLVLESTPDETTFSFTARCEVQM